MNKNFIEKISVGDAVIKWNARFITDMDIINTLIEQLIFENKYLAEIGVENPKKGKYHLEKLIKYDQ